MSDKEIHQQIDDLVAEEHSLRSGETLSTDDRARLQELEILLDRAWDLLRRREALREAGQNPDEARGAPIDQVEGYLQ